MKTMGKPRLLICILLQVFCKSSSAFIFKWPLSYFYPGITTTPTFGAGTINFGFLRPAILVPVTTAAPTTTTTTTTTTRPPQFIINGFPFPIANNSLLITIANALANRPVVQPLPLPAVIGGGGGIIGGIPLPAPPPQIVGGFNGPSLGGGGSGFVLPGGFPVQGGVATSGLLPGLFPGILGRSSKGQNNGEAIKSSKASNSSGSSGGKVVFQSLRK